MKLVKKKLVDLHPSPYNPRVNLKNNNKPMYDKLKHSIESFGLVQPIIWNKKTGNVVGGHQRLDVLQDLGYTEVDVVVVDLNDNDEKALNLGLNKISGDWDTALLNDLLSNFKDLEYNNIELTGFDEKEINEIFDQFRKPKEENFELPKEPKYKIQTGDIIQLGNHRLMCGDSTKKDDIQKLMESRTVDLLITDPPYNVNYSSKNELLNLYDKGNRIQTPIENDFQSEQQYIEFSKIWFKNCLDILADYNSVYIFGNYESLQLIEANQGFVISNILVWVKNNIVLGRMDYKGQHENILYGWKNHHHWYGIPGASTVFKFDKPLQNKLHPTMKPIELLIQLIKNSSQHDMIVFDPFGGSGSTLIASEQTNRICYMMEIDPYYCSVILERWEQYTGKTHEKINNH